MKKQVLIIIMIVAALAISIFSLSYAYFSTRLEGKNSIDNIITVGKLHVKFSESNVISIDKGVPILDENASERAYKNSFSLEHESDATLAACYTIKLNVTKLDNRFKSQFFKWSIYDVDNSAVIATGNFDDVDTSTPIVLLARQNLPLDSKRNYELWVWLSYSETVDQSNMLLNNNSSVFEGNISVESKTDRAC